MITIDRQIPVSGSIWQCEQCHIWWGSQVGEHPLTLFLLRLPEHLAAALDWIDYRGWKYANPHASSCPICHQEVLNPTYSLA
jgi:hypothetical protein